MSENFNKNQKEYWDKQHKNREHEFLVKEQEPNELARRALKFIKPGGKILEVGIANGRDARFFVRENNNLIVGVDISTEAIRQLIIAAIKDKTIEKILPLIAEASEIPKILGNQEYFNAFYARSSLHLDDDKLITFLQFVTSHLINDGVVIIEGKLKEDFKIERSLEIGKIVMRILTVIFAEFGLITILDRYVKCLI